ncbi:hypothetical protein B0I32_106323 [Nonomuraea fuscirosea]|uniref:Uncharacterized protein n=1 Tax=Nonomuraea fuscirosea TaxID=1291556 RepID=A0A2T0N2L1_9ACTN|nr:hypothetical protein [Nonomuraea fuscirosea]PRX66187.1 hypothetical protein B0I32_106323 [Nonomuraea fuscirosea]
MTITDIALETRYVLAGIPGWGEHDHLIRREGLAVVNSPRYVAGDLTWTGEIGHGRYYAAGKLEQMAEGWHADGAVLLVELTPQAVVRRVKKFVDIYGSSLEKLAASEGAVGDLAEEMGLPWEDGWLQVPFVPAPPRRVAISGIPLCEHGVQAQAWVLQVVRPGDPMPEDVEIGRVGEDNPTALLELNIRAAAQEGLADQYQLGYIHKDMCRTADDPGSRTLR